MKSQVLGHPVRKRLEQDETEVLRGEPGPQGHIVDPVCFMEVHPDSPYHLEHAGVVYGFCRGECLLQFRRSPAWYLQGPRARLIAGDEPDRRMSSGEPVFAVRAPDPDRDCDPVCGMTVCCATPHRFVWENRTYHFCTAHCLEQFRAGPGRYIRSGRPRVEHAAGSADAAGVASRSAPPTESGGAMDNHQRKEEP